MGIFDKFKGGTTEDKVRDALRVVIDPDLHKDIVTLGFVKEIQIQRKKVSVNVELTTPACPVKDLLREQCEKSNYGFAGCGTS